MTSRRQARQDAMVVLYQHDITDNPVELLLGSLQEESGHELDGFTRDTVDSVLKDAERLDAVIDRCSSTWKSWRIAPLERSILRIAVREMLDEQSIPLETSIDEAVILAKRFCSREAASLVNGILGKLADELKGVR